MLLLEVMEMEWVVNDLEYLGPDLALKFCPDRRLFKLTAAAFYIRIFISLDLHFFLN
jgi:hypothetical protein